MGTAVVHRQDFKPQSVTTVECQQVNEAQGNKWLVGTNPMALHSERVFCLLTAHDDYAFWLFSIILHSLNSQEHHS